MLNARKYTKPINVSNMLGIRTTVGSAETWFSGLRKFTKKFVDDVADEFTAVFKNTTTEIKGVDDIMGNLNTMVDDFGDVNVVGRGGKLTKMDKFEGDLRGGDAKKAFKDADVGDIGETDSASFRRYTSESVPDVKLNEMDIKKSSKIKGNEDLQVSPKGTGKELEDSLSPSTKKKVEESSSSIISKAGTIAKVSLGIFGVVLVTDLVRNLYDTLNTATINRNGCFLTWRDSESGEIKTCKLTGQSCKYPDLNESDVGCGGTRLTLQMSPFMFLTIEFGQGSTDPITTINQSLTAAGYTALTSSNYVDELKKLETAKIVEDYIESSTTPILVPDEVCNLLNNSTDICINHDPSTQLGSIYYLDPESIPSTVTIKCVRNSTIFDTMLDWAESVGEDIFDTFTTSSAKIFASPLFSTIFWGAVLIFVIYAIFKVISTFAQHNHKKAQANIAADEARRENEMMEQRLNQMASQNQMMVGGQSQDLRQPQSMQ